MSLYITRHGETDYNIKELVCGISEAMLSDKGIKQAQKLADLLKNIDYKFLYVSPLQRAIDTANYANVHQIEMMMFAQSQAQHSYSLFVFFLLINKYSLDLTFYFSL